jgi:hypothetical protein
MGAYADKIAARGTGVTEYAGSLREPKTSGWDAALHGAATGISLGALPLLTAPIEAGIYKASGGKDSYGDFYSEALRASKAEEDLLQKEHPIAYGAGEASSYLLPAAGSAKLFGAASKVMKPAAKSASLLAKIGTGAARMGAGFGATEAAQGLTESLQSGEGDISDALKETVIEGAKGAGMGAAFGGGLPLAGAGIKAAYNAGKWAIPQLGEKLTSTPWEALVAHAKDPKAIEAAAGSEEALARRIAQELAWDSKKIPEINLAEKYLPEMNMVDINPALDVMNKMPVSNLLEKQAAEKLAKWEAEGLIPSRINVPGYKMSMAPKSWPPGSGPGITALKTSVSDKALTDAVSANAFKKALQGEARSSYGLTGEPEYADAVKNAARKVRLGILDAAKQTGGEIGENYPKLMAEGKAKTDIIKGLKKTLGRNIEKQPLVAEQRLKTMYNKNATPDTKLFTDYLEQYDAKFGTDLLTQAKNASLARKLGKSAISGEYEGKPKFLSQAGNGLFNFPFLTSGILAGLTGNPLVALGAASSSPALWRNAIAAKIAAEKAYKPVSKAVSNAASKVGGVLNSDLPSPNWRSQRGALDLTPKIDPKTKHELWYEDGDLRKIVDPKTKTETWLKNGDHRDAWDGPGMIDLKKGEEHYWVNGEYVGSKLTPDKEFRASRGLPPIEPYFNPNMKLLDELLSVPPQELPLYIGDKRRWVNYIIAKRMENE